MEILDRLIPSHVTPAAQWEQRFPARPLAEGAEVTRFAPSPTGFVHVGGILVALIAQSVAVSSGGVFILRVEDTDQSRYVEGAVEQLGRSLEYFGIIPDESVGSGAYGPYVQSERAGIYDSFVRVLLEQDSAYPCFCTSEELAELTARQQAAKAPSGYWGPWAACRSLTEQDVVARLDVGTPFVIRFRATSGDGEVRRVKFSDRVRGDIEMDDNRNDVVVRKTMGLPTYHLAHAVDDHLMRVTTVVRADEWLSSVPLHLQLFDALGFDAPQYAHIAPIVIMDGKSKRKLSKRKDPQANVDWYAESGYPVEGILCYLRGLANARLQDEPWQQVLSESLRLEECSNSGQLLDLAKLASICREVIADLPVEQSADRLLAWAQRRDPELAVQLAEDRHALLRVLSIEQTQPDRPRKDLATWGEFREKYGFLIPAAFTLVTDPADARFDPLDVELVRQMAAVVADGYKHDLDGREWFEQVRTAALSLGFSASVGEYKREPERFRGPLKVAANVIRVLLTGSTRSPDLYEASRVLGATEVFRRLASLA
ncbi:glutamate--tRNA ligase [Streptacidiphilus sp. MAP5-52]|uniref:glutamate--tRNA ligase n=1 Tax=Streptacidiphilus sp. MAP5-52 TaxID=3156267 RepID=UPI003519B56D